MFSSFPTSTAQWSNCVEKWRVEQNLTVVVVVVLVDDKHNWCIDAISFPISILMLHWI